MMSKPCLTETCTDALALAGAFQEESHAGDRPSNSNQGPNIHKLPPVPLLHKLHPRTGPRRVLIKSYLGLNSLNIQDEDGNEGL